MNNVTLPRLGVDMPQRHRRRYRFGAFELDQQTKELRKHGIRLRMQEQPLRILLQLVEHPGELISREELHRCLWPDGVFVDFDRNLNRAVVRLRQALSDDSEAPRYIETLPRLGYRFIAPVETIEGAEETSVSAVSQGDAREEKGAAKGSGRRRGRVLVAAGVVAILALGALLQFGRSSPAFSWRPAPRIRSIAVLPFRNLSGDATHDYLSEGMTEEITTDLARFVSLRVVSATSARHYGEKEPSLEEIARELKVDAIVEGSVTISGGRVRVNAQLVDTKTDTHLWAQVYDRNADEIAEVHDLIASEVVHHVAGNPSPAELESVEGRAKVVPEAYDAYLRGRSELSKQTQESMRRGLEHFEKATSLDRLYAPGYAGIADAYVLLANYGGLRGAEAFPKAKSAALKALDLDHTSAEAHCSLGYVNHHFDWDWSGAERQYKEAIQLDPSNALAHMRYGELLSNEGRADEALAEVRVAQGLAPGSLVIQSNVGRFLYYARRYDEAIAELKANLAADPSRVYSRIFLALCYMQKQMYDEAFAEYGKVTEAFNGQEGIGLAQLYARVGKAQEARRILAVQERPAPDGILDWYYIAATHAQLGEKDNAFLWLERAHENRDFFLTTLKVDPLMDPLRSDARFGEFLERIGIPH